MVLVDNQYAATFQFRDEPRAEGLSFVRHLGQRHQIQKLMLVSGDRESEVRYLADRVGIREVHAGQSPEQKLQIVRAETAKAQTLYLGDGINDAPALAQADVGMAIGTGTDVAIESSDITLISGALTGVVTAIQGQTRVALTFTAYLGWRGSGWVIMSATMATTLLLMDAWFDTTTARPGWEYAISYVTAICVELPLAFVALTVAVRAGKRHLK